MVLVSLSVPVGLTDFDNGRARTYCACAGCGWGMFGFFFFRLSFPSSFSLSLWQTARYRLKYCLKGPLNQKQPSFFAVELRLLKVIVSL